MLPRILLLFGLCLTAVGCGRPQAIDVDDSSIPYRFIIEHRGWPAPFKWPRVTEFAIGSDADELLWQLESVDPAGEPARRLAFIYGRVPPGFSQVHPKDSVPPKALEPGRSYYVGATGPGDDAVYRMVFALSISPEEAARDLPPLPR